MVDELRTEPPTVVHCPWCSAEIAPALASCPACGATLTGDTDASLPGVTALDQEAILRARRLAAPQRRNRILGWINGDYDEVDKPDPPGSLSPPPLEVRREMLRLELLAEEASLRAQTDALVADAALEAEDAGRRAQAAAASAGAPDAASSEAAPVDAGPTEAAPADDATPGHRAD